MKQSITDYLFNPLIDTDGYKLSHPDQYPEGMDGAFSYISARGISSGYRHLITDKKITWFGMQAIVREVFSKPLTKEMVDDAEQFYLDSGATFQREGFDYVVNECKGYFPITIESLPEGTKIEAGEMVSRLYCTDKKFVRYMQMLETLILRVWYPSSVATISTVARNMIREAMLLSCDNLDGLDYKLCDFGSRGVSSPLSAAIGGAGHFAAGWKGSDTNIAVKAVELWYDHKMKLYTIDASEHSTMTSWGLTLDGEIAAYRNMIKAFGKRPMFACVSDASDIERACSEIWGGELKDEVVAMSATLIIRPDSGDPVCWLPRLLDILADKFGFTMNTKGFKVLNKVRLIQGDGVTLESLPRILDAILFAGFSIDNVAFGMGGGLLQKVDRDTFKWAMKMSAIRINGVWHDVFKDPITDPGKASLKGLLTSINGKTIRTDDFEDLDNDDFHLNYHYEQDFWSETPVILTAEFEKIVERSNA